MAKFIWNADKTMKHNMNMISNFYICAENEVCGFVTDNKGSKIEVFYRGISKEASIAWLDTVTMGDFDKIGEPFVKLLVDIMQNSMFDNKGGFHA